MGARPLVALTFLVKLRGENDFDHVLTERPTSSLISLYLTCPVCVVMCKIFAESRSNELLREQVAVLLVPVLCRP